jgi:hypothetical protein
VEGSSVLHALLYHSLNKLFTRIKEQKIIFVNTRPTSARAWRGNRGGINKEKERENNGNEGDRDTERDTDTHICAEFQTNGKQFPSRSFTLTR